MNLQNDVARCDGKKTKTPALIGYVVCDALPLQCMSCLRLIAPRPEHCRMMQPPEFIEGKCQERIADGKS